MSSHFVSTVRDCWHAISVIFVNENENENEKMMKTKTKLKRENGKLLKTKTKMKMPKQQNLSRNESASTQYGA